MIWRSPATAFESSPTYSVESRSALSMGLPTWRSSVAARVIHPYSTVTSCPGQLHLFELFAKKAKLVAEQACELGIRCRKENLSRPVDRQVTQVIEK